MASDNSAPALNLATFFAGIVIVALVEGLIPVLSLLSLTEKFQNQSMKLCHRLSKIETQETKASRAFLESTLLNPDSAAIALISSALFIIRK